MFTTGFGFSKINSKKRNLGDYTVIEHVFSFRGKTNKRYIVTVEEYKYFVYIVKFYLKERKNNPDRFNQLTNLNECSRVLTTIGHIILDIYKKNPFSSFGFIGSNLPGEVKENTKRFKLYSKIVTQVISPLAFEHRNSIKYSAYLLINRDNHEEDLLTKINDMFDRIYLLNQ